MIPCQVFVFPWLFVYLGRLRVVYAGCRLIFIQQMTFRWQSSLKSYMSTVIRMMLIIEHRTWEAVDFGGSRWGDL